MASLETSHRPKAKEESAWLQPGPAAFDFRSDVQTTPTREMLEAITYATLGNDVSYEDDTTNTLQDYLAQLTSHEAALFVLSGTMGNLLGIRSLLTQPPYGIISDSRSHFLTTEAGGTFLLTGAVAQPVLPSNGQYLTLEDILPHVKINPGRNVHMVPTRLITLENTFRGMVMPLSEARRISEFAHLNNIKVHLDGARLWEAATAGSQSPEGRISLLKEYCSLFDTVTMCFSKGLGAPAGGILLGSNDVIRQARWFRQSIGGGMRQPGLLTACAYTSVKETFETGKLEGPQRLAREVAEFWQKNCRGKLAYPTDTNMVWLDLSNQRFTMDDLRTKAATKGLRISRERLVLHYQISKEAIDSLKAVLLELASGS